MLGNAVETLTIPQKAVYFDQVKAVTKTEEYRLCTPYWIKRLVGREYDQVTLTMGYPARDDAERRMTFPWRGYVIKTIQHEHFGPKPVEVFAIKVGVTA
jgi:hypothetical protein